MNSTYMFISVASNTQSNVGFGASPKSDLTELAYIVTNRQGIILRSVHDIINLQRDDQVVDYCNDISSKTACNLTSALYRLKLNLLDVEKVIFHNAKEQYRFLISECYRNGSSDTASKLKRKTVVCTMQLAKKKYGSKNIDLDELYFNLVGIPMMRGTVSHRAAVCKSCYFTMNGNCMDLFGNTPNPIEYDNCFKHKL